MMILGKNSHIMKVIRLCVDCEPMEGKCLSDTLTGLIVRDLSGFYYVEAEDGQLYTCRLRGRLKEIAQASDIAVIGDRVTITPVEADGVDYLSGIIESVEERTSVLSRAVRTTGKRGAGQAEREHVLIANADQAFFVFARAQPTPNLRMLDRLLVTGEGSDIADLIIVVNKCDIDENDRIDAMMQPYRDMGYEVLMVSAVRGDGVAELYSRMAGKISVFTGPSGVGKSSLLNAMQPELGRAVKAVSDFSQEGMHTTRDSALIKLDNGGYIADTPGIRSLNVWDIEPDELDGYFRDIAKFINDCRFRDCLHVNEPGCAVRAAVERGDIHPNRYENFVLLRDELKETYIAY